MRQIQKAFKRKLVYNKLKINEHVVNLKQIRQMQKKLKNNRAFEIKKKTKTFAQKFRKKSLEKDAEKKRQDM